MRDMRKHIQKDHKEIYEALTPFKTTPARKRRKEGDLEGPEDEGDETGENGIESEAIQEYHTTEGEEETAVEE